MSKIRWVKRTDDGDSSLKLQTYDHTVDRWVDVPTVVSQFEPIRARAFIDKDEKVRVMTEDWSTWGQLPRGGRWLGEEFLIDERGART